MKVVGSGVLTGLGTALEKETFETSPVTSLALCWEGIAGDRHSGLTAKSGVRQKHHPKGTEIRNARQLSLVSEEELEEIATALGVPAVDWRAIGANLCVRGISKWTQLAPSSRLLFESGACVVIDGENEPCRGPGRKLQKRFPNDATIDTRFVKAAWKRRGLVGWVERPGVISVGMKFEIYGR